MALKVEEVDYDPNKFPALVLKSKDPNATALILSSGKILITGIRKKYAINVIVDRIFKKFNKAGIKFSNFTVQILNIVVSIDLHKKIDLKEVMNFLDSATYDPELFPGLIYRMRDPNSVFIFFPSGRIFCVGLKNKNDLDEAIFNLYALLEDFFHI